MAATMPNSAYAQHNSNNGIRLNPMTGIARRAAGLRIYQKLPDELRPHVVRYLIIPDTRIHEIHHPRLDLQLPYIAANDIVAALKSMCWMEVVLEHGEPQDQADPRRLCSLLGALASSVSSRLPPDLHHHIQNPRACLYLSAQATLSDKRSPFQLRVLVPVDPRNTCEIMSSLTDYSAGLRVTCLDPGLGVSLDRQEDASAREALLFFHTILKPLSVSSRPGIFSAYFEHCQKGKALTAPYIENPLLRFDFMVRYVEFAYSKANGYGKAAYTLVRALLVRTLHPRAYPNQYRRQFLWLLAQLQFVALKNFNKWAHVEVPDNTTRSPIQQQYARLQTMIHNDLRSVGWTEQMQHNVHLECAKTAFIFYQLFIQRGHVLADVPALNHSIGHINAARKLALQPGVVDNTRPLIEALIRHARGVGAAYSLTRSSFSIYGLMGTMEEFRVYTEKDKEDFARRERPEPPPHLEPVGWCERVLNS